MAPSKAPRFSRSRNLPAVDIRGLTVELPDGRVLWRDLNASIGPGITALVGSNGAGKTTLARALCGDLEESVTVSGSVIRNVPVTAFAQREEPDPSHAHLSGGEWMRARLDRLMRALEEPGLPTSPISGSLLILDEPTNDLDRDGRDAVLALLRARARDGASSTLIVSHDREVLGLCDQTLELGRHGLAVYGGGWRAYEQARAREHARLERRLEAAERERDRAREVRRTEQDKQEKRNRKGSASAAKGGQAKILLGLRKRNAQATTGKIDTGTLERAERAAAQLAEAVRAQKTDPVLYAAFAGRALPAQKRIAEARGFNLRHPGKPWLYPRNLDFAWRGNCRIVLEGGNGSGKSTLMRAVLGTLPHAAVTRGELVAGLNTVLYLDQRCSLLDPERSVFDNMRAVSAKPDAEIRNLLAGFLFSRDAVFQPVRTLSGGERLRAALARGFFAAALPEVLVLDEPTNNLDLANIAFLERVVAGFEGAVILVSHDTAFAKNCGILETLRLG